MAGALMFGIGFIVLPGMVVDHDLGAGHVAPQDRLTAINNVRTTLLQTAAGVALLFGAYATWRQLRVSQDTLRITQEGHLTEQFGRAIDQLGSDKQDVRIGGLHALWRLAKHSEGDRQAVISTMAAFLRTHQPWPPAGPPAPAADADINDVAPLETRAPDSQLALTGLGVLCLYDRSEPWLNLSLTDLRRADFDGLWLIRVNFDRASMESASLYGANLTRASMVSVSLQHAEMRLAKLTEARCVLADLRGARMAEAVLNGADFTRADLREAVLRKTQAQNTVFHHADLRNADLRGADLSSAELDGARFEGAVASDLTRWPATFNPQSAGITVAADPGPEPPPLLQPPALLYEAPPLRSTP
ncbi:pentapeptide repeat-containing protein [Catenulispora acidiphila]|nr:pentapeptide repeat-containing protein [Catenulispora acidiphila]